MTKLLWHQLGERTYETGVDRGVLYLSDRSGIVWNGLISVDESPKEDKVTSYWIDGIRYFNERTIGDYAATISAFTYPEEFYPFEGYQSLTPGVVLDEQPVYSTFFLSYRTFVGNDVMGIDYGYKIHLLYNLTATPSGRKHHTLDKGTTLSDFSWDVVGIPESVVGYRPTSHVIFDTRHLDASAVMALEDTLYGTDETEPFIPTLTDVVTLVHEFNFDLIDHGDGSWTASGPEEVVHLTDETSFEIEWDDVNYDDAETYTITD